MKARHLAATALVIWLAAACAGAGPTTNPGEPPPPPLPPPPPPPIKPPPGQVKPVGYFVAPSPQGSGEGDGTIDHPWSYEQAFAGAAGKIHPGDTVWFRAGTYVLDQHRPITVSGTGETSRVVFRA